MKKEIINHISESCRKSIRPVNNEEDVNQFIKYNTQLAHIWTPGVPSRSTSSEEEEVRILSSQLISAIDEKCSSKYCKTVIFDFGGGNGKSLKSIKTVCEAISERTKHTVNYLYFDLSEHIAKCARRTQKAIIMRDCPISCCYFIADITRLIFNDDFWASLANEDILTFGLCTGGTIGNLGRHLEPGFESLSFFAKNLMIHMDHSFVTALDPSSYSIAIKDYIDYGRMSMAYDEIKVYLWTSTSHICVSSIKILDNCKEIAEAQIEHHLTNYTSHTPYLLQYEMFIKGKYAGQSVRYHSHSLLRMLLKGIPFNKIGESGRAVFYYA